MIKQAYKKKILDYILSYKKYLIGSLISLLITSSTVLALSHSVGYIIDKAIATKDSKALSLLLLFFVGIAVLLAIGTSLRYSLVTLMSEYVIKDIRRDIYNKILTLSPMFYEKNRAGDLLSRLVADTTLLQSILNSSVSTAMRNAIMLAGGLILLAISSLKLTCIILLLLPTIIAPVVYISKNLKKMARTYQENIAELSAISEETVSFIKVVQAYAQEKLQRNIFNALLENTVQSGKLRIKIRAVLVFVVICLIFSGIGLILWTGGNEVISGILTPGQLSTFILLTIICATTAMSLMEASSELQKAVGATQKILDFLDEESEIKESEKALHIDLHGGYCLTFKNVIFAYPSNLEKKVLNNVSFTVTKGKVLAIVGESGAGKSTIVQLALRFYNIQGGQILIDGIDTRDILLQNLRQNFGYVGQEPAIFSTSASQNIMYGRQNATKDEVISAAKAAAAYQFISNLPNGFDTFLGAKGVQLSGGQKQRIAIARALLKNPKILLLDEATSSLDNQNELAIQKALETLMADRTTIVIAHRMSTITKADEIILLKNGVIAARGIHQDLIKSSAEYMQHFDTIHNSVSVMRYSS